MPTSGAESENPSGVLHATLCMLDGSELEITFSDAYSVDELIGELLSHFHLTFPEWDLYLQLADGRGYLLSNSDRLSDHNRPGVRMSLSLVPRGNFG
jgi:hypothetical protein